MQKSAAEKNEDTPDTTAKEEVDAWKAFPAGIVTGLVSCYLFNPWDRALYLSVKDKRYGSPQMVQKQRT